MTYYLILIIALLIKSKSTLLRKVLAFKGAKKMPGITLKTFKNLA